MEDRAGHEVALRDPSMIRSPDLDLQALSDGDLDVLNNVWNRFGHLSKYELRDYKHSSMCPEWEDPHGSSRPLPMGRLFKALRSEERRVGKGCVSTCGSRMSPSH